MGTDIKLWVLTLSSCALDFPPNHTIITSLNGSGSPDGPAPLRKCISKDKLLWQQTKECQSSHALLKTPNQKLTFPCLLLCKLSKPLGVGEDAQPRYDQRAAQTSCAAVPLPASD